MVTEMGRGLHKTSIWMLTASVMMGSLVPPALSHAHDGGTQTHSHHASVSDHDRHGGHHHRGDTHSSPEIGLEVAVSHLHWCLLGIEFSFPVRQDDESNGPQNGHDGQFGVVRFNDDVLTSLRMELPESGEFSSIFDATGVEISHARNLRECPWAINSVWRSAHIARSGVLLI